MRYYGEKYREYRSKLFSLCGFEPVNGLRSGLTLGKGVFRFSRQVVEMVIRWYNGPRSKSCYLHEGNRIFETVSILNFESLYSAKVLNLSVIFGHFHQKSWFGFNKNVFLGRNCLKKQFQEKNWKLMIFISMKIITILNQPLLQKFCKKHIFVNSAQSNVWLGQMFANIPKMSINAHVRLQAVKNDFGVEMDRETACNRTWANILLKSIQMRLFPSSK